MALSAYDLTTKPPPAGPVYASRHLPGDLASVPACRHWLVELLTALDVRQIADAAGLIVSELAANAVKHTKGPFEVHVCRPNEGYVRLEVHDRDDRPPHVRAADDDDECGRGLYMVDLTAAFWGFERTQPGKKVYAYLACETTA